MFSVAEQLPALDVNINPATPAITLVKKTFPAPAVGDKILVPDSDGNGDSIAKKYVGGYATVGRVVHCSTSPEQHFLYVTEHSGYKEYKWQGYLAEMQEELSLKFKKADTAYLKSI